MPIINDISSLKANAKALDEELKEVFRKYGLEMSGRSARIGQGVLDYKIKLSYGTSEEKEEIERKNFTIYSRMHGIDPNSFGKVFRFHDGKKYKVVGCNPSKPKNFVKLMRLPDGKSFQCSGQMLNSMKEVG